MYPYIRYAADPFDGLKTQLTELRGMVNLVPPLIEADRDRRWEEIGKRPGDPDVEMIDIYEQEAGEEEGYGHADYARTVYSTAVVMSWEAFHAFLTRVLREKCFRHNLEGHSILRTLVAEEVSKWDRRFDDLVKRFKGFAAVDLKKLSSWPSVDHARELRNALVHNLGFYTERYVNRGDARRITPDDIYGARPRKNKADWVDSELIPLDQNFVLEIIAQLIRVGAEVKEAVLER